MPIFESMLSGKWHKKEKSLMIIDIVQFESGNLKKECQRLIIKRNPEDYYNNTNLKSFGSDACTSIDEIRSTSRSTSVSVVMPE